MKEITVRLTWQELTDIMTTVDDAILYWQEVEEEQEERAKGTKKTLAIVLKDLQDTKRRIDRYKRLYTKMAESKRDLNELL